MITLLTGQPGHGKTTRGLVLAHALKKEGRVVYAHGEFFRKGVGRHDPCVNVCHLVTPGIFDCVKLG